MLELSRTGVQHMGVVGSEHPPAGDGSSKREQFGSHSNPPRILRFGPFEVRPDTGELYKHGVRLKLQSKPLQILVTLAERPGELVTREELRHRLWPSGTFVDFESGLNTAINRLRTSLGDSPEKPLYIETLPRLGYRFICPVESVHNLPEVGSALNPGKETGLSGGTQTPPPEISLVSLTPPSASGPKWRTGVLTALGSVLVLGAMMFGGHLAVTAHRSAPEFRPISVRGETITSARFLAESGRVIYSAKPSRDRETFIVNTDGTGDYPLPFEGVLASASPDNEVAIFSRNSSKPGCPLELSRSSLKNNARGTGEIVAENASVADLSPDGKRMALVREGGTESLLEFPAGHVVYRSQGWLNHLRVSRNGREVAFLEHPVRDDDAGHVRIVDATGYTRVLTANWSSAEGLAWSPSGNEIWFTASDAGVNRRLYAVSRSGKLRKLAAEPSSLRLLDVSSTGRVLLAIDESRMIMRAALPSDEGERDITQFDFSHIDDISQDGHLLLFTESGDAGGEHYAAYVYDQNARKAKRFGPGRGLSLSPDGKQALTIDPQDRTSLTLTFLDLNKSVRIPGSGFRYQWARFFKADELIVGGAYPGQPLVIGRQNISGGKPVPISGAPYLDYVTVSPDGANIAGRVGGKSQIFNVVTRSSQAIPSHMSKQPVVWGADGKTLFFVTSDHFRYSILKLNVATGRTAPWRIIAPHGEETLRGLAGIAAAPESGTYAYSTHVNLSRLYVVDGLT